MQETRNGIGEGGSSKNHVDIFSGDMDFNELKVTLSSINQPQSLVQNLKNLNGIGIQGVL